MRHSVGNLNNIQLRSNNNYHNPLLINTQSNNGASDEIIHIMSNENVGGGGIGNMSKHTLHAISAVPKPKYTDVWVQQTNNANRKIEQNMYQNTLNLNELNKRNYNQHWLIQEAEQRRIEQSNNNNKIIRNSYSGGERINLNSGHNKPLPDSIIQTLTQRVQSRGIGERVKNNLNINLNHNNVISRSSSNLLLNQQHQQLHLEATTASDNILSVSGKKKCSHCGDELGKY